MRGKKQIEVRMTSWQAGAQRCCARTLTCHESAITFVDWRLLRGEVWSIVVIGHTPPIFRKSAEGVAIERVGEVVGNGNAQTPAVERVAAALFRHSGEAGKPQLRGNSRGGSDKHRGRYHRLTVVSTYLSYSNHCAGGNLT